MAPDTIPLRAKGSTAIRTISQRVAPSASAASSWSFGVCRKTSRQIAVMIGRIITASTRDAVRIVFPVPEGVPLKIGIQPRLVLSHL